MLMLWLYFDEYEAWSWVLSYEEFHVSSLMGRFALQILYNLDMTVLCMISGLLERIFSLVLSLYPRIVPLPS